MKLANKSRGGRPPKFQEASRPVTVTLPLRTLKLLESVDKDRARAITKSVDAVANDKALVEVVDISKDTGLIVVGPSKYLARIGWLRLIEIAPARFLLSIPSGTGVDSIEIALLDQLDDVPASDAHEKTLLQGLLDIIRSVRRSQRVTKGEILFVASAK